ncbi:MAG TPA: DMT family transporter [Verrucomicrobiae bacterium]|nr:DMT family transporter [Verrucomicrobiae bacterium]
MKPSYLIILLVMNLCWAAVYSAYKVIGHALPTGGIVTLRFGMAGLCLLFIWPWLPGKAPRGRDLWVTCGMGLLLFVLGQRLQVYGNEIGSAGNSAVLMGFEPLITSVAAALFLHEHIGPRRWAGFGLGLLGVGLLHGVWRRSFQWVGLVPSLIFISSFVCEAGYSVLGKPIIQRASVMKMLAISLLVGMAVNLVIDGGETLRAAGALTPEAWGLLVAMAVICTTVGYTLWLIIIRECSVNVAALTIFTQSAFGVALAGLWLGEKLHWEQFAGSVVIIGGMVLGLSRQVKAV